AFFQFVEERTVAVARHADARRDVIDAAPAVAGADDNLLAVVVILLELAAERLLLPRLLRRSLLRAALLAAAGHLALATSEAGVGLGRPTLTLFEALSVVERVLVDVQHEYIVAVFVLLHVQPI